MHDQLLLILENAISSKIYTHQILLNFRPCIDQRSHPNVPTQHSQHQVRLCPPHSIRQCQLLQLCYCVVKSYTTSAYLCCNLNSCFSLSSFTSAITMFPNLSAVYMFSVRSSRFFLHVVLVTLVRLWFVWRRFWWRMRGKTKCWRWQLHISWRDICQTWWCLLEILPWMIETILVCLFPLVAHSRPQLVSA